MLRLSATGRTSACNIHAFYYFKNFTHMFSFSLFFIAHSLWSIPSRGKFLSFAIQLAWFTDCLCITYCHHFEVSVVYCKLKLVIVVFRDFDRANFSYFKKWCQSLDYSGLGKHLWSFANFKFCIICDVLFFSLQRIKRNFRSPNSSCSSGLTSSQSNQSGQRTQGKESLHLTLCFKSPK